MIHLEQRVKKSGHYAEPDLTMKLNIAKIEIVKKIYFTNVFFWEPIGWSKSATK